MADGIRILAEGGDGRYEEKKSRFLASAVPVHSEEEALAVLEQRRKTYWDARHHCSAWVIGEDRRITRASDDGEPSGTAGRPILDVINGEGLIDTMIVVTRYFGGTLLGTGGLIRSYREAAKDALANSRIAVRLSGIRSQADVQYTEHGKIAYLLRENGWFILKEDYAEIVRLEVLIPEEEFERAQKLIQDETGGKVMLSSAESCAYLEEDGKPYII